MILISCLAIFGAMALDEPEHLPVRFTVPLRDKDLQDLLSLANVRIEDLSKVPPEAKPNLVRLGLSALILLYRRKELAYFAKDAVQWTAFWAVVIQRYGLREAAAAALASADGPIPVMDLIAVGLTLWTILDILYAWDDLWNLVEPSLVEDSRPRTRTPGPAASRPGSP
jgi:hypothetical protein